MNEQIDRFLSKRRENLDDEGDRWEQKRVKETGELSEEIENLT